METYVGIRHHWPSSGVTVLKGGRPLRIGRSLKVRLHSPTGFEWGYGGSGPAQLALALLLEETIQEEAELAYQDFKDELVAQWPSHLGWMLRSERIHLWLTDWRRRQAIRVPA